MPWLKLLHIIALVIWCGSLIYLPALVTQSMRARVDAGFAQGSPQMPRFFYNSIATPAALLAIFSGTLLFLWYGVLGGWLVLKLMAVMGMVAAHGGLGWWILRLEAGLFKGVKRGCIASGLLASGCIVSVLFLVLAKPMEWS
ncbi:CopD family protein [Halomonas sp. Bachu 37]|uniref:CopD family protein n=1 Tax=Halomonas kashgarensis TaxID=3084920 RepID=UPI00321763AD